MKLEPDGVSSKVVQSIFRLALAGEGVKEISKWLNHQGIPSPKGKRWAKAKYMPCWPIPSIWVVWSGEPVVNFTKKPSCHRSGWRKPFPRS